MGKVVLYGSVSVDGFVADENDQPGPLFDWLTSGDVPLDDGGHVKVSQASHDYTRAYWDEIGVTVVGRHVFDLTDGWGGTPPSGIDHVVVVSHRPAPEGWRPEAPFHFVDGVEAAMAKAQELAGDRTVEVAAGDVGGQVLAAGLVDEVAMDVAPVVIGSGKRYFGSVDAQHLLEDPDVVIQGNRVLHVRYRVIQAVARRHAHCRRASTRPACGGRCTSRTSGAAAPMPRRSAEERPSGCSRRRPASCRPRRSA